jgi:hypothetical protein
MTLSLVQIRDLAYRFIPGAAADDRLYRYGSRSWWPAHEIGHFLIATRRECRAYQFGLDINSRSSPRYQYAIAKEIAAMSISQRMLRRSGHVKLADEEIEYTDEDTLDCSHERWCKRAVGQLLREHRIRRLPTTLWGLEILLTRKACEVDTKFYASAKIAIRHHADSKFIDFGA